MAVRVVVGVEPVINGVDPKVCFETVGEGWIEHCSDSFLGICARSPVTYS
jgi:hypothetical protein